MQGFSRNKNEPVKIEANKLEVRDKEKLAIFSGNVFVQQGDTTMRSPELRVFYEADASKTSLSLMSPTELVEAVKRHIKIAPVDPLLDFKQRTRAAMENPTIIFSIGSPRLVPEELSELVL